jgi:hypothetical protein
MSTAGVPYCVIDPNDERTHVTTSGGRTFARTACSFNAPCDGALVFDVYRGTSFETSVR